MIRAKKLSIRRNMMLHVVRRTDENSLSQENRANDGRKLEMHTTVATSFFKLQSLLAIRVPPVA